MPQRQLRTLGSVALVGPAGEIPLDEPLLIAFVVLIAIAGADGVRDDELLLRLTPEATPAKGRAEITRLTEMARQKFGGEAAILRTSDGYALAPNVLELDVRVLDYDAPAACVEFLERFELPDSPEFGEWLAFARRRVEPRAPQIEDAVLPRKRHSPLAFFTMITAGVVVVAAATGLYLQRPRAPDVAPGDRLLVADVDNQTGDPLFGTGISSAASIALQQSGRVSLYPRTRLPQMYRLMQIQNVDTALTFELSKAVAQRDGVRFVLVIAIARVGSGYRVTGRLADVANPDDTMESSALARSKGEVLAALDHVVLGVRRRLGESRGEIRARTAPLPSVTTGSLEALRSYGDGSIAWATGNRRLAEQLWLRAVDLDTGFAMAYDALARFYYYNRDRGRGERYLAEALRREGRLSDREHLSLFADIAGYRGAFDSASYYSGQLALRYPSAVTWYNYGTSLMAAHRDSEAVAAFRTSLRYDSAHTDSYINLATVSKRMRRYDAAIGYYERAGLTDSTVLYRENLNGEWGSALVSVGRYADAESAFTRMTRGPRVGDRALGFRSLGFLAMWEGHLDEAAAYFRQAADAAAQARSGLGELRDHLLLSATYRLSGREHDANAEVTAALAFARQPYVEPTFLTLIAIACLKSGRVADAELVLRQLRARRSPGNAIDSASEAFTSGLLALATRHPDSALVHAHRASKLPMRIPVLSLEAEAFRALNQLDSARVAVTRLRADEQGFSTEGEEDWLHAPLVLGDILLAQRDTAGAVRQYQLVLDQWRGAAAPFPDIASARARIAALHAGSRDHPRN